MLRILLGACVVVGSVLAFPSSEARESPLFKVDHTYSIAWDCAPSWAAVASSVGPDGQPAGTHQVLIQSSSGCYAERLKVRTLRRDGWVTVIDISDGTEWTINPPRAMAVREYIPARQASR